MLFRSEFERHPERLKKFPEQAIVSSQAGVNHMGWPMAQDIDPSNEFMPCGQGVGAIRSLVPAGDIVRSIVAEAERVVDAMQRVRR